MKQLIQNISLALLFLLALGMAIVLDNPRNGPTPAEVRAPGFK